jgi:hypothetical protein
LQSPRAFTVFWHLTEAPGEAGEATPSASPSTGRGQARVVEDALGDQSRGGEGDELEAARPAMAALASA